MNKFLAILVCVLTTACTSLPTPETPREVLATAEVTFIGVAVTAGDLYDRGVITQDQLGTIVVRLKEVAAVLDEANAIITGPIISDEPELLRAVRILHGAIASLNTMAFELKEAQQ